MTNTPAPQAKQPTLEPDRGNFYRPHRLMVTSGQFWRCRHGNTGLGEAGVVEGCAECAKDDPAAFALFHGLPAAHQQAGTALLTDAELFEIYRLARERAEGDWEQYGRAVESAALAKRSAQPQQEGKPLTDEDAQTYATWCDDEADEEDRLGQNSRAEHLRCMAYTIRRLAQPQPAPAVPAQPATRGEISMLDVHIPNEDALRRWDRAASSPAVKESLTPATQGAPTLRTLLQQVRADMGNQDVLMEWWGAIDAALAVPAQQPEGEPDSLLRRATTQLTAWHKKYGEHDPSWPPPAGDVALQEDIGSWLASQALAPAIWQGRDWNESGQHWGPWTDLPWKPYVELYEQKARDNPAKCQLRKFFASPQPAPQPTQGQGRTK